MPDFLARRYSRLHHLTGLILGRRIAVDLHALVVLFGLLGEVVFGTCRDDGPDDVGARLALGGDALRYCDAGEARGGLQERLDWRESDGVHLPAPFNRAMVLSIAAESASRMTGSTASLFSSNAGRKNG